MGHRGHRGDCWDGDEESDVERIGNKVLVERFVPQRVIVGGPRQEDRIEACDEGDDDINPFDPN